MNTYAILYHLVKLLNYIIYEYVLIKRVKKRSKRTLTAININKVFI